MTPEESKVIEAAMAWHHPEGSGMHRFAVASNNLDAACEALAAARKASEGMLVHVNRLVEHIYFGGHKGTYKTRFCTDDCPGCAAEKPAPTPDASEGPLTTLGCARGALNCQACGKSHPAIVPSCECHPVAPAAVEHADGITARGAAERAAGGQG